MAEIHIFSGLGSSVLPSLRKGTEEIEQIIDDIAEADHHIWSSWKSVARDIIARKRKIKGPIVLIGHSNGVYACMKIAQELFHHGIPVHYIAAIDPTLKPFPKARSNVGTLHEFRASRGIVATVRKVFGFGQVKTSRRFHGDHAIINVFGSHVGIVRNPQVKFPIRQQVKRLVNVAV